MGPPISVVILTKNSEKCLPACLDSLRQFNEVVILDNGSSDKTRVIANSYSNVQLISHSFIGFGPLKNLAIENARNNWIFSIDSDEVVTSALLQEIMALTLAKENEAYSILRDNYYNGRLMRCCGWHPDRVCRLFNRVHTRFNSNLVHESIVIASQTRIVNLKSSLEHFPYSSAEELIEKMQFYSTLYARQNDKNAYPLLAFLQALLVFIKNYFFQKGFLYGYEGLLLSVSNANGVFYKYLKLHEKNKKKST